MSVMTIDQFHELMNAVLLLVFVMSLCGNLGADFLWSILRGVRSYRRFRRWKRRQRRLAELES